MPRIVVKVAPDPTKCAAELIKHHRLGGLVCPRCGTYYDPDYLKACGLEAPLLCGAARIAGTVN